MPEIAMHYEDTEQALSREDIDQFEKAAGVTLPEAFKQHYLSHNGGYPVDVEDVVGAQYIFPFHGFLPLKYGALPIEMVRKDLADDFEIVEAIPFAYDQGSNIFYISTCSADFGVVYQVTAETKNRFTVCNSFEEFLKGLDASK
jgi:SMI1-KNR4 cell-wall